jgi:WXG100 protein secretion system (Wss), protein YukD
MGTLLVTVAHGGRRRDLAVRSDVPIADLLAPLADALAIEGARPGPGEGLGLAPVCEAVLPLERSLMACGVGHGAVLVLVDRNASCAGTGAPSRGTVVPGRGQRPPRRLQEVPDGR